MSDFPKPSTGFPLTLPDGSTHPGTVFLKAVLDHPRLEVGDYTYASDFDPPDADGWAARLAPFLHAASAERLIIGKFCQIAHGVRFVTASANHRYDGFSSFPFAIFDGRFDRPQPSLPDHYPDTIIGHDVWIGTGATVLPGAQIGSGVIVGAGAVVGGRVPDYSVVTGNPAKVHRTRFAPEVVRELLQIAWWDWPIQTILAHEALICGGDVTALRKVRP